MTRAALWKGQEALYSADFEQLPQVGEVLHSTLDGTTCYEVVGVERFVRRRSKKEEALGTAVAVEQGQPRVYVREIVGAHIDVVDWLMRRCDDVVAGTVTGRLRSDTPRFTEVERGQRTATALQQRDAAYAMAYGMDFGHLEERVLAHMAERIRVAVPGGLPPGTYTVTLDQDRAGRLVVHPIAAP